MDKNDFYNKIQITQEEKAKADYFLDVRGIEEHSRNCYLLKEKIKEINTIWAYIITTIDDEFEISLRANGYKPRYTNANDGKILYFYNEGVAHIYALDIKAITADAFARNKTFLDILKNN